MLAEEPWEWQRAPFERADRAEWRGVPLFNGRPPGEARVNANDDWFEELRLDRWEDGDPVYRSIGFSPRDRPDGEA